MTFPDVNKRPDVWQVHILEPILLHLLELKKFSGKWTYYNCQESDSESDTHDQMESIEDYLADDWPDEGDTSPNLTGCDRDDIKFVLLSSHSAITTEIIFLLLCGKHGDKWISLDAQVLVNEVLSSSESIFKKLTAYEIDGILRILQRYSSEKCCLFICPKMKKLTKSNFLGHILGHYHCYIPERKKFTTMPTLSAISSNAVERCIPEDVIRVELSLWTFRYDINYWLNNSPVPVTVELPIPPHEFNIFSYPDLSTDSSQIESHVINPSHHLTNL